MPPSKTLKTKKKFSPEYRNYIQSDRWRKKSRFCRSIANCCLFPWLPARETHHLTYRNLGKELIWRDILPLSKTAHKIVGSQILWRSGHPKHRPRIVVNLYLRLIGFPLAVLCKAIGSLF